MAGGVLGAIHATVFPVLFAASLFTTGLAPWLVVKQVGYELGSVRVWFLAEPAGVLTAFWGSRFVLGHGPIAGYASPEVYLTNRAGFVALACFQAFVVLDAAGVESGYLPAPDALAHPKRWLRGEFISG